ncbi:cell migration-inducing and hyaluronan-binding protein-like [Amphibalanus amphitrite]|uniref:cell migration-inducing and hyaluronan-binding protein-like n=1 Tax=Amphibalanus amphitrite TaxID=1232801 RepID=UPI001C9070C0|nr:cell migration-inducing and hyaluronan-binding protein-like [Amphibalanus amphitrite]
MTWWTPLRTLCLAALAALALAACPHEGTLKSWSDAASWASGTVPAEGEAVVVSEPMLLDTATPDLLSVTVEAGGRLVFDPAADLAKLAAEWIKVAGELHVGAEDCPFTGQAEIELLGKKNVTVGVQVHENGTEFKALVVVDGGRLEVHGQPRQAWTRLQTTLPQTTRELVVGNALFNHRETENVAHWYRGFMGYQFNSTGQPVRYMRLRRSCDFSDLVTMQGSVVLLVVQRKVELDRDQQLEHAADAFEQVCYGGGQRSHLRDLSLGETVAWAAICHVGHPENTIEELGHPEGDNSVTSRLVKQVGDVEYLAQSVTRLTSDWPYEIDMLTYTAGNVPDAHIVLDVSSNVSDWRAGDTVAITSTDYDWRQAEEFTLLDCPDCSATQIMIGWPVRWTHWGETTDGVNMGAEVGLLKRNVRIHGRMEDACYGDNHCGRFNFDTFGGQIKVFANFASVRIVNAEIFHMGQNSVLGAYPIHFHMCGDVDTTRELRAYVRSNAIHHTFARCVTVHGTSGLLVEGNMAYDHFGHCFFLEDGSEKRTVFRNNLGFSTRRTTLTPSDHGRASTFWITNPLTTMEGNVAGGSEGWGIWYTFPRKPIGPSAALDVMEHNEAMKTPLDPFIDNVAHSNNEYGLHFDGVLRSNGHIHGGFNYDPREDPLNATSPTVVVTLDGFTAFKNYKSVWLRMSRVVAKRFNIAESVEGVVFAWSGAGEKRLEDSLIVGETANKGRPEGWIRLTNGTSIWWDRQIRMNGADNALPIIGVIFHDTIMSLNRVTFDRFESNIVRPSGGIGMRRKIRHYTSPVNSVSGLVFRYADPLEGNRAFDASEGRGFADLAGNIQNVIRDLDGSLTTYANSTVVKPYDIHLNARCAPVPQWNLYVCPTMFTKLLFMWWDRSVGNLNTFLTRNDGSATFTYGVNFQNSYALNSQEGYIVHFNTSVPRYFKIRLAGVEAGVVQTVGLCIGKGVTPLTVEMNSVPVPSFDSLDDQGADVHWYLDTEAGVLFFRFSSPYHRTADTVDECPGQDGKPAGCPEVLVVLPSSNTDGDCSGRAYPAYSTEPLDSTGGLTTPDFTA